MIRIPYTYRNPRGIVFEQRVSVKDFIIYIIFVKAYEMNEDSLISQVIDIIAAHAHRYGNVKSSYLKQLHRNPD